MVNKKNQTIMWLTPESKDAKPEDNTKRVQKNLGPFAEAEKNVI